MNRADLGEAWPAVSVVPVTPELVHLEEGVAGAAGKTLLVVQLLPKCHHLLSYRKKTTEFSDSEPNFNQQKWGLQCFFFMYSNCHDNWQMAASKNYKNTFVFIYNFLKLMITL